MKKLILSACIALSFTAAGQYSPTDELRRQDARQAEINVLLRDYSKQQMQAATFTIASIGFISMGVAGERPNRLFLAAGIVSGLVAISKFYNANKRLNEATR